MTFNACIIDIQNLGGCGGELTDTSGTITSTEWPLLYPNNQNCTWKITFNDTVQIKINNFEIGPNLTGLNSLS